MSSREYMQQQDIYTLETMNRSKSAEISRLNDWIENLKAERDRYKAALEKIADYGSSDNAGCEAVHCMDLAQQALKGEQS